MKFKDGDKVTTKYGPGVVVYVTPAERLKGEQTYHVECENKSTYDFGESELTPQSQAAPAAAHVEAQPAHA